MIPLFVFYTLIVWWCAARWRRRWPAFAAVVIGVGVLGLGSWLYWRIGDGREFDRSGFMVLMYSDMAIVGAAGLYIACLPRSKEPGLCARCGYDLAGLEPAPGTTTLTCPECGSPVTGVTGAIPPRYVYPSKVLTLGKRARARRAAEQAREDPPPLPTEAPSAPPPAAPRSTAPPAP